MSSVMKLPSDYKREIAELKEQLIKSSSDYEQEIADRDILIAALQAEFAAKNNS